MNAVPLPALGPTPSEDIEATPGDPAEHLSADSTRNVLLIQQTILSATRDHLAGLGFNEMLAPIMGPVTDPGGRGSKQVDVDYYGHRYKLMTSAILYKQASLLAFDRIFCIAPCVRLEPLETASTRRHLAEFHQIDVEIAGASLEEMMVLLEGLVRALITRTLDERSRELDALGRDTSALESVLADSFDSLRHTEAVAAIADLGHQQSADAEIDWRAEVLLSQQLNRPTFVVGYPKGSRGFYDRESAHEPGVLRNLDLLAPEGFGELCSGSEREFDYARIVTRMRETGENPAKYAWYLRMVRQGIPASAGFGIGLERFTRYVAGLDYVWQASAYPKIPGVVAP